MELLFTLSDLSGTYWLTWESLAIVSRLTRIIRSIDPTVENLQVNDIDLCEIHRDENQNLPLSLLLNLLCYTIEKCRFESRFDIVFSWKFVLFSIHITLLWEDIYTPCLFCTYQYGFITLYYKFTYLKTLLHPQRLEPASCCSPVGCPIH